jgi:exodeoxyribonuclease VII small subunit
MPSKTSKSVENASGAPAAPFEKALERLETIVQSLESGEAGLDQSLELYAEGIKLSQQCFTQLSSAEKRVKELTQSADGLFKLLDSPEEGDGEA